MKLSHLSVLVLFMLGTYQCTSSNKIISINSELAVVEATKTPKVIGNIPGALLKFTVISSKDITLNHIRYWGSNVPITINRQLDDSIWIEAEFKKPNDSIWVEMENKSIQNEDSYITKSNKRQIDSTCTILYTYKKDTLELVVPKLKLLKAE